MLEARSDRSSSTGGGERHWRVASSFAWIHVCLVVDSSRAIHIGEEGGYRGKEMEETFSIGFQLILDLGGKGNSVF